MTYPETTEYLFSQMPSFQNVGDKGYKPGLERIREFCESLGNPPLKYPVIHIAGTNGKGSTSHMLASILASAGYRVGLFTSPHLRDFRERMRVNGEMIGEAEVVSFVERWRERMEEVSLSFFEMTAAMCFDHFAEVGVDIAVIETGLGGRLDATNIVEPALSIITNIGLDHTQYLGDSIAKVASEKAGIIKARRGVVVGERATDSDKVFIDRAEEMGSTLLFAEDLYRVVGSSRLSSSQRIEVEELPTGEITSYEIDLMGGYQRRNILTTLAAIGAINTNIEIPKRAIEEGLRSVVSSTSLCGRWQTLCEHPKIICDTAHNVEGIREVVASLRSESFERLICIFGSTRERDHMSIIRLFDIEGIEFIATEASNERATPAEQIARDMRQAGYQGVEAIVGVREALERAIERAGEEDLIFVGGSNFVVAELDLN